VIILDTNPHAWTYLHEKLPLKAVVANLLVFINAHLAINHANQVAVLASHSQSVEWLYPTPDSSSKTKHHGLQNGHLSNGAPDHDANKYPPFRTLEKELYSNLARVLSSTTTADLTATTTTMIAGALTTALCHINKAAILDSPPDLSLLTLDPSLAPATATVADTNDGTLLASRATLTSRILVLSVSGDLASQYIPVMNAIFAAQRQRVPIDILKVAGDTVFLQQASDATGGVYVKLEEPRGLLQYLMMGFLPDATARRSLVLPSVGEVDFRAACFCHRKVVDVGYVCSVCLSSEYFFFSFFLFLSSFVLAFQNMHAVLPMQMHISQWFPAKLIPCPFRQSSASRSPTASASPAAPTSRSPPPSPQSPPSFRAKRKRSASCPARPLRPAVWPRPRLEPLRPSRIRHESETDLLVSVTERTIFGLVRWRRNFSHGLLLG
jgi:transcription initiation factor TFIIH subunit 3